MSNNVTSEIHCVDENRINRYFYDFRNNVYILLKTKKIIKGFLLSMWRYLKYIIKIIKYAPNKKMKRILVITKGTIYGLFFHPKIEYIK